MQWITGVVRYHRAALDVVAEHYSDLRLKLLTGVRLNPPPNRREICHGVHNEAPRRVPPDGAGRNVAHAAHSTADRAEVGASQVTAARSFSIWPVPRLGRRSAV